jgi:lipoprotein-anchoring transpeptidase ErfK/SrfK
VQVAQGAATAPPEHGRDFCVAVLALADHERDVVKFFKILAFVGCSLSCSAALATAQQAENSSTPATARAVAWQDSQTPTARQTVAGNDSAASGLSMGAGVAERVQQRLQDNLSSEMLHNFGLFIYVSKADVGPWAQHMFVFQKAGDDLLLLYDWPVSTGRETVEADAQGVEVSTGTPAGYYELDPKRIIEKYRSIQWNEPMPYAMFFNFTAHGTQTGLAIHGTEDGGGLLGMRASAGCVRLAPENARTLFMLVRDNYKGLVPKLAFDKYTSSTMNNGLMKHDENGSLELTPGYSALVYIDEFGGDTVEAQAG